MPNWSRFLFKMPRVVPNQKDKFETDEFLKRHSREAEVGFLLLVRGGGHPTQCLLVLIILGYE